MPRMMTVDLINSSSSWPTSSWPWEMPQSRRMRLTCRTRCWWTGRPPSLSAWCLQRYESVRGQPALPTSHALHGLRVRKYPGHRHHPPPGHPLQRPDDPTQQHVVQAGPNGNLDCVRRSVTDWWCWHTSVPVHKNWGKSYFEPTSLTGSLKIAFKISLTMMSECNVHLRWALSSVSTFLLREKIRNSSLPSLGKWIKSTDWIGYYFFTHPGARWWLHTRLRGHDKGFETRQRLLWT